MSVAAYERIASGEPPAGAALAARKVREHGLHRPELTRRDGVQAAIVKFLGENVLPDNLVLVALLAGASEGSGAVFGPADDAVKRLYKLDMEDPKVRHRICVAPRGG
jgi:hypothetical protein